MKRFDVLAHAEGVISEITSDCGRYVSYHEAAAIIAEKDKEIAKWTQLAESAFDSGPEVKNGWLKKREDLITHLQEQLRASNEQLLRVVRGDFGQICSYCGWEARPEGATWDELQAHIKVCPEHPLGKCTEQLEAVTVDRDLFIQSFNARTDELVAAQARIAQLSGVIGNVCEGFTLPDSVRKILETSVYSNDNLTALAERDAKKHAELVEIHKIGMCIAECPPITDTDTATVSMVKGMAHRLNPQTDAMLDAERWRTLRALHWSDGGLCVTYAHAVKLGYDCPSEDRLDEAVDAITKSAELRAKG